MTAILPSLNKYQPNPAWAKLPLFSRTGWKRLPFGAFADSVNVRVEPADAAEEVYVGLDDLDPGCLRIRRWGKGSDVIGTKLRFRKGDLIFGRRRAYQRKLAVAEMEGICSAHAMVVRAKPGVVRPDFLPFLMMSDKFMRRAVEISVGSLSPTINWTTLKHEEFDLPPPDQQRRIAEILWAVDEMTRTTINLRSDISQLEKATGEFFFSTSSQSEAKRGWLRLTGQTLLEKGYLLALQDGNHGGQYPRSQEFSSEGLVYLSATNISDDGKIDFASCPRLPKERANGLRIGPARGGDVILTNNATVGRVAIIPLDAGEIVASTSTTYYRPNTALLSREFLAAYLKSTVFQKQLSRVMVQSTRNQVPITTQKKLNFFIPPLRDQEAIVSKLNEVVDVGANLETHLKRAKELQTSFIGQLSGGG